jgi:membrane dipeptidase
VSVAIHIDWSDLTSGRADLFDGTQVEISGWIAPIDAAGHHDYFLFIAQPSCCFGCLPSDPSACVEVFARSAIPPQRHSVRLAGHWRRLVDDPAGWRYQLRDARLLDAAPTAPVTRRAILSAGALGALAACAPQTGGAETSDAEHSAAARQLVTGTLTVDIHSHAGRILRTSAPLEPVAAPMREGGMAALCLAMVADSPATRLMPDRRIRAVRKPEPGELYAWSRMPGAGPRSRGCCSSPKRSSSISSPIWPRCGPPRRAVPRSSSLRRVPIFSILRSSGSTRRTRHITSATCN